MKVLHSAPPNIDQIKQFLSPPTNAIFAYGDTIYNPSGLTIDPDLEYHESVHQKQQQSFRNAGEWWDKYLTDKDFRKSQEVEAYGGQYQWIKSRVPEKWLRIALEELGENLAKWYNLDLTVHQAKTLIRLHK